MLEVFVVVIPVVCCSIQDSSEVPFLSRREHSRELREGTIMIKITGFGAR